MNSGDELLRELLRGLASPGSAASWREFLEIYSPVLQQVVRLMEAEPDNAADCFLFICQQLANDQFRRLRRFEIGGPASFTTWLRAVARNLAIDWHRKKYGRLRDGLYPVQPQIESLQAGDSEPLELRDGRPDPEKLAADEQQAAQLRRVVAGLDKQERLLIQLRFEQELTLDQIARITGIKDAQTVDRRLRQILQSVREKLPAGGGKLPARSV